MNLCNVCKKYFNEPHDCTATREEKLPRMQALHSALSYNNRYEFSTASRTPCPNIKGEIYISEKEHESLLREARAKVWEEASNATHQYPHYVEFRRFCRSKAVEARKE